MSMANALNFNVILNLAAKMNTQFGLHMMTMNVNCLLTCEAVGS